MYETEVVTIRQFIICNRCQHKWLGRIGGSNKRQCARCRAVVGSSERPGRRRKYPVDCLKVSEMILLPWEGLNVQSATVSIDRYGHSSGKIFDIKSTLAGMQVTQIR